MALGMAVRRRQLLCHETIILLRHEAIYIKSIKLGFIEGAEEMVETVAEVLEPRGLESASAAPTVGNVTPRKCDMPEARKRKGRSAISILQTRTPPARSRPI